MNALIPAAWAQAAGGPGGPGTQFAPLLMIVVMFGALYFLMIRPQQKKMKDHQNLVARLAPGDEVVTSGGLLGRITEVGDAFVTIEVADGVRVKVQKVQITQLVPKGTLKSA